MTKRSKARTDNEDAVRSQKKRNREQEEQAKKHRVDQGQGDESFEAAEENYNYTRKK